MNRRVVQSAVLIISACIGISLCAQSLEIKLVDGRNGLSMAGACVNTWVGSDRKEALAIPTDDAGVARLRLTVRDNEIDIHNRAQICGDFGVVNPVVKYEDTLRVNAGYVLCDSHKQDYSWLAIASLSTKELIQRGIVTPNFCGKATTSPTPGQVTIFVRPLTWWEKLKQ